MEGYMDELQYVWVIIIDRQTDLGRVTSKPDK